MCVRMWVSYVCSVICQKKNEIPETKGEKMKPAPTTHTCMQCIRYPVGQFVTITISCSSDFFAIYCCVIHILYKCVIHLFYFFKHPHARTQLVFLQFCFMAKMKLKNILKKQQQQHDLYADLTEAIKIQNTTKITQILYLVILFSSSAKKWQNRPDGFWFVVK